MMIHNADTAHEFLASWARTSLKAQWRRVNGAIEGLERSDVSDHLRGRQDAALHEALLVLRSHRDEVLRPSIEAEAAAEDRKASHLEQAASMPGVKYVQASEMRRQAADHRKWAQDCRDLLALG